MRYEYDSLYRLTSEKREAAGESTPLYERTYTYDANGNRATQTAILNGCTPEVRGYSYDERDRLIEETVGGSPVVSYAYHHNGNTTGKTTSGGSTTYDWDALDRLVVNPSRDSGC